MFARMGSLSGIMISGGDGGEYQDRQLKPSK